MYDFEFGDLHSGGVLAFGKQRVLQRKHSSEGIDLGHDTG